MSTPRRKKGDETARRVPAQDEAARHLDKRQLPLTGAVSLVTGLLTVAALWTSPGWPGSTDATYFIKGLTDYDLTRLQPQWPGYPVYLALAWPLKAAGLDAARALHLISAAGAGAGVSLAGLIAALLNPTHAVRSAALSAALLATSSVLLQTGSEIYSDTTGLTLGLGAALLALSGRGALAGLLAGLSLGARPSELPLLLTLAALPRRQWAAATLALTASTLAWLGAQLLILSPAAYLQAARTHLNGHYDQWGGGLLSRELPTWGAQLSAGLKAAWTHGLGGWWPQRDLNAPLRLGALIWPALLILSRSPDQRTPARSLLILTLITTVIWTALNHDLRLDRYWLTPAALAAILLGSAPGLWRPRHPSWLRPSLLLTLLGLLTLQGAALRTLILSEPPAEYRAAQWAGQQGPPGTVTVLSAVPTPLMGAGSPYQSVQPAPQGQRDLDRLAAQLQGRNQLVFLITDQPPGDQWTPAFVARRNEQVRSREEHEVTVLRFNPLPESR